MANERHLCITGASGFVGSYVKKHCKALGYVTTDIDLRKESRPSPDKMLDVVLHLAGKAHDLKHATRESMYFDVNTELTKKVFDSFLNSHASTFIYVSSIKAVLGKTQGQRLSESTIPQPDTAYGKSKWAAEIYLLSHDLPKEKKLYILRPCMIHGPGNKGNLNLLYQVVKRGIPWPLGAFENKRSFLSIDNFCFVIDQIVAGRLEPSTYHLADSESFSTNELIRLIAFEHKSSTRILRVPRVIIKMLARCGDWLCLPLNSERLEKLTESYEVSNQYLVKSLGSPLPVSARDGFIKTIKSFQ